MLGYRLAMANGFHWEFKQVFRYSKPLTYSTFIGGGGIKLNALILLT